MEMERQMLWLENYVPSDMMRVAWNNFKYSVLISHSAQLIEVTEMQWIPWDYGRSSVDMTYVACLRISSIFRNIRPNRVMFHFPKFYMETFLLIGYSDLVYGTLMRRTAVVSSSNLMDEGLIPRS